MPRAEADSLTVTLRSFETDAPVDAVGRGVSEHNTASRLFSRRHSLTAVEARFNWGIGAGYRALHEYRQTDPRPRNVVSDFNLDISAGYLFDNYRLNADASLRLYRQFQEVSFLNERGANTSELHFTGLGTHFERFAGSGDYCATRYRGTGDYINHSQKGDFQMSISKAYKVPNAWVLDAVNLSVLEGGFDLSFDSTLDAGFTYCSEKKNDSTKYNKSVRRIRLDNGRLADTNNSTNDFTPRAVPTLKENPNWK